MKHSGRDGLPDRVERWQTVGFGLYVHWPFCQAKCPYCDFNSHVVSQIDHERWVNAYLCEIRRHAEETRGRVLRSIFFGGGTPSLMPAATVEAIINEAALHWVFANDIEITLEANPTSFEIGKFRDFKSAGVNRVSVGVQALNDKDLRRLGRMHSAEEAKYAVRAAQEIFPRTSFDLIYARQDQTVADWDVELTQALSIAGEHLSLYQLTIEPDTVFGARSRAGQLRGIPMEDTAVDMFTLTQEMCASNGLPAYEISNHAAVGAISRHNSIYWQCGDYLGIGPGAHGRMTNTVGGRFATVCPKPPGEWLRSVEAKGNGELDRETLSRSDQAAEYLLMGLRMAAGIDLADFMAVSGRELDPRAVEELVNLGHLVQNGPHLRTTLTGKLLLNSVISALLP